MVACLVLAAAAAVYAAGHLAVDTDIERMLPSNVAWRQNEKALDEAFPQNNSLLVAVIDGRTPDLADKAAGDLAERMRGEPQLFTHVRQPDGGPFFDRNGLLFLSPEELEKVAQQLIAAQPLMGSLAHDPSLRGLFDALATFVSGADTAAAAQLDPTLALIANGVQRVVDGRRASLSWQQMMTGRKAEPRELRRFVVTRPVLDFTGLEPGETARTEIRRLAGELGITPDNGLQLRLTGPVALDDEQFATLREGALRSTVLSVVMVCAILFIALRSVKLVGAIIVTLAAGFMLTAGFAALAIGSLNLISIAFGVLFIGLAVDFSIQFSVRYRDQRHRLGTFPAALRGTALTIGPSLVLAAGATAIGFLSFVPTRYTGIQALGWIAGGGMLIAIALNFLLLPALLAIVRPRGEPEAIGFRRAAPLDRWLIERRQWVIGGAALLAAVSIALLPQIAFDFDPLNLKNPNTESVSTARDLMKDPMTTPYTAEILAPSLDEAKALAERVGELPEVAQVVTAASFIPDEQDKKLPIIEDLALLLGPTLNDPQPLPPPSDEAVLKAMAACGDAMEKIGKPGSPAARLGAALHGAAARGAPIVAPLRAALLAGLLRRLDGLREMTQAKALTLQSLPPELRDGWIAADGRARIEVFPKGDARDNRVLERFVAAVHSVAPHAPGTAEMGILLTISLVCTLFCTFIVLPALLGPARVAAAEEHREAAG